jgi:P-type Cu2+ transporter
MNTAITSGGLMTPTSALAAWDDPSELARFTRFANGASGAGAHSRFAVEGLHCAACAGKVQRALAHLPGVESVEVNAATRVADVRWTPSLGKPSAMARAVAEAGYILVPLGDPALADARRKAGRLALWRWLVAVFSMMQVMMYAAPAYFTSPEEMGHDAAALMRWAAWVLTVPVVLFSAGPFFAQAWRDARRFRVGMDTPVALGIAITFAMGTLSTFEPSGPWGHELYLDSLTMFVAFLLTGRWLEARMHERTAGALEALSARLPVSVQRETEDGVETVAASRLRVGDVMRVPAGEVFAADAVVLGAPVLAEEALLTGEFAPVERQVGDEVVAGSYNLGRAARVKVLRTGDDTRFAAIVALMERAQTEKPFAAQLADRFAPSFLLGVLLAAAAAAVWWWPVGPAKALSVAVAVLIVTCPCALSLATPAALLSAAGALARRGLLVRRLSALERLADVNRFIFDKTGTACTSALSLEGVDAVADITPRQALDWAAQLAAHSTHPVSAALVGAVCANDTKPRSTASLLKLRDVAEVSGLGVEAIASDGSRWRLGQPQWAGSGLDERSSALIRHARVALSRASADPNGWAAAELVAGFRLNEQVHPAMAACVDDLSEAVPVELLSGDRPEAVARVAHELGVVRYSGGARPADKLAHLQSAQQHGDVVAMVGDGLNDGPTLARADVSFAMGRAVPLAQAKSDFIVQSANPADVAWAYALARRTRRVMRQNLGWAAAYNAACIPLALMGWLPPWLAGLGMALSSLLVVGNALRLSR